MQALLFLGSIAFLICLVATPALRSLSIRLGFVDHPDTERKRHTRAVPRTGGVPIALSYAAALAVAVFFNPGHTRLYIQHHQLFRALLPAAAIIFATGLLDDIYDLKPWQKLLGQFAGAGLAVYEGARLSFLPDHPYVAAALSFFWLVGCSNAVNLIDGMDGLATGVGLFATATTMVVALITGNHGLALATAPLLGCLLAFLRYNFSPASIFLGDCGSLTIGFALGCFGLAWSQRTGTMVGMLAPLMALSLPLIDVCLAIGRRFLRAVPITRGDRDHIHHKIQGFGFSTPHAALLLYAVCGIAASLAVLESLSRTDFITPTLVLFCFLVLVGIRRLRYVEFIAFGKTVSHRFVRRAVQDHILLEELDRALLKADSLDDCWPVVRTVCSELGFASITTEWDGVVVDECLIPSFEDPSCHIKLVLGERGSILLTGLPGQMFPPITMSALNHIKSTIERRWIRMPDTKKEPVAAKSKTGQGVVSTTAA